MADALGITVHLCGDDADGVPLATKLAADPTDRVGA
jgi:hypothetical protein